MTHDEGEIVTAIIAIGNPPLNCTWLQLEEFVAAMVSRIREQFPGMCTEQFSRCLDISLGDPQPDHAAIAVALFETLTETGATTFEDLDDGGARVLAQKLESLAAYGH